MVISLRLQRDSLQAEIDGAVQDARFVTDLHKQNAAGWADSAPPARGVDLVNVDGEGSGGFEHFEATFIQQAAECLRRDPLLDRLRRPAELGRPLLVELRARRGDHEEPAGPQQLV